jgi:hypothetical protein
MHVNSVVVRRDGQVHIGVVCVLGDPIRCEAFDDLLLFLRRQPSPRLKFATSQP